MAVLQSEVWKRANYTSGGIEPALNPLTDEQASYDVAADTEHRL
jgi:hypothetical protein